MGEFEALPVRTEPHGVFADDIAAAEDLEADLGGVSGTGVALVSEASDGLQGGAPGPGNSVAKGQSGPGRCVDLVAVVGFEDLDLCFGAEGGGGLFDEGFQEVDAHGEVGGPHRGR